MKKLSVLLVVLTLVVLPAAAQAGAPDKPGACTTIQSGTLLTEVGTPITTGFDQWGYNYQGHLFSGGYCDAYRDDAWCQAYKDVQLGQSRLIGTRLPGQ